MNYRILATIFILASPLALRADPAPSLAPLIPPEGIHITNDVLAVGISARDAGAVNSVVYDGAELVNDHDHGRQLQIAWSYNALGESDNPTEAGSAPDSSGPASSSQLLEVHAGNGTLTTKSHPAYWHPPGDTKKGRAPACTQIATADILEKTLTLGYHGDPHVIVVDSSISISPELTGPPVTEVVVETPAFYVPGFMTENHLLDRSSGECVHNPPKSAQASKNPQQVLILSSSDGRYAVGLFAPEAGNFMSYNCRYVDRLGKSDDNVAKVTLHYRQKAQSGDRLTYRTFAIVGDLSAVKASILKLP